MKLKKLWVALFCAACLIGSQKSNASEALVTMNGKPIVTSEEVIKLFDKGVRAAFNIEMIDRGVPLEDLSINDLPIDRAIVQERVSDIVKTQVMESIVQEWFKKHKDQESVVAKETLQQLKDELSYPYTEKEYLENFLPTNRLSFFCKKHFGKEYYPQEPSKEEQIIIDNYKKEYGIEIHEDKVNKLVNSIVLKWNIQK